MNSIKSIRQCLESLREAGVSEVVVVDAHSTDGTSQVAQELADVLLKDPGVGLGNARNLGIRATSGRYILNLGSDNVITSQSLSTMLTTLVHEDLHGVSALTVVEGDNYLARCINAWWTSRFRPGLARVIGTPSLFRGDILRKDPYDSRREHSDDSELCERWARKYSAQFAICDATVLEVGKNDWHEVSLRCRNYGVSDYEVFSQGVSDGWGLRRRVQSVLHPSRVDLFEPLLRLGFIQALKVGPFLIAFTVLRYRSWIRTWARHRKSSRA